MDTVLITRVGIMCNSKVCFKCLIEKPLSEFYKHKAMGDGHLNKCKDCTKKDSIENREKNIDYYREYDKSRASIPHRVEKRLHYSKTEIGKEAHRKAKQKWNDNNVIKKSANIMVARQVRSGNMEKPDKCESCGITGVRLEGHHDDYSKPLDVRWLCSKCHRDWHKKNGSGLLIEAENG